MGKRRRTFSSKQKGKIAIEALRERKTGAEIASKYNVHPNQVSTWKKMAQQGIERAFERRGKSDKKLDEQTRLIEKLYGEIGQLQVELKWLKKKYDQSKY